MTTIVKQERIIAERDGRGWLVMWSSGDVEWFRDKGAVLRAVRSRIGNADLLVSEIEWRIR